MPGSPKGNALPSSPLSGTNVSTPGVTGESNTGPGVSGQSIGLIPPETEIGTQPASDGVLGQGMNGVHGISTAKTTATTGAGVWVRTPPAMAWSAWAITGFMESPVAWGEREFGARTPPPAMGALGSAGPASTRTVSMGRVLRASMRESLALTRAEDTASGPRRRQQDTLTVMSM